VPKPMPYATGADFCRIFHEGMSSLYLLSLLLTGDPEEAEMCFVRSLEDCAGGPQVFKEWAWSWARRTVMQHAIRLKAPQAMATNQISTPAAYGGVPMVSVEIARVMDLPAFDRFAFVLSILERLSDQECSLLLSCSRREVKPGRTRGLTQLANLAELDHKEVEVAYPRQTVLSENTASFISVGAGSKI